jgi:hypothetical protein
MKNLYFENFENSREQSLIEDLVIESIKIYGVDCWYLPKTSLVKDELMNEVTSSIVNRSYMTEMYIKNVEGFEGEGDFLSKFGLQIRDSMTLTIANRVFEDEVSAVDDDRPRPLEGDLIYFPLNRKIYEIMHVEHEAIFYQMGSLQTYDLRCELFEYSGEIIATGQPFIDSVFRDYSNFNSYEANDLTFVISVDETGDGFDVAIPAVLQQFEAGAYQINVYEERTYSFDISNPRNSDYIIRPYTESQLYDNYTVVGAPGLVGSKLNVYIPSHTYEGILEIRIEGIDKPLSINIMQSLDSIEQITSFDKSADNQTIETVADNILDFSEQNPFGEETF